MAGLRVHIISTGILTGLYLLICTVLTALLPQSDIWQLLGIFGLGILIDFDHISIRRIKKLLKGDRTPFKGWTNWAHTVEFAFLVIAGTIIDNFFLGQPSIDKFLPAAAYFLHILIDAGNTEVINSPLPSSLSFLVPSWLKYKSHSFI